jgi:hypothetical protein
MTLGTIKDETIRGVNQKLISWNFSRSFNIRFPIQSEKASRGIAL